MTNFLDFISLVGLSLRIKCLKSHWFLRSIKLQNSGRADKIQGRKKLLDRLRRVLKNFVKKFTVKYFNLL